MRFGVLRSAWCVKASFPTVWVVLLLPLSQGLGFEVQERLGVACIHIYIHNMIFQFILVSIMYIYMYIHIHMCHLQRYRTCFCSEPFAAAI